MFGARWSYYILIREGSLYHIILFISHYIPEGERFHEGLVEVIYLFISRSFSVFMLAPNQATCSLVALRFLGSCDTLLLKPPRFQGRRHALNDIPIRSMGLVYLPTCTIKKLNVGKYTIHASYGIMVMWAKLSQMYPTSKTKKRPQNGMQNLPCFSRLSLLLVWKMPCQLVILGFT